MAFNSAEGDQDPTRLIQDEHLYLSTGASGMRRKWVGGAFVVAISLCLAACGGAAEYLGREQLIADSADGDADRDAQPDAYIDAHLDAHPHGQEDCRRFVVCGIDERRHAKAELKSLCRCEDNSRCQHFRDGAL